VVQGARVIVGRPGRGSEIREGALPLGGVQG
jgi:hypothetical protein